MDLRQATAFFCGFFLKQKYALLQKYQKILIMFTYVSKK